jgi:N-acetylneuraminic acid mutarotase
MRRTVALLFTLFLAVSCLTVVRPAFSSADAAEDTWMSKAPMQQARSGLGVVVVNGKIYAIGGSTRKGGPQVFTGGYVGTNEEYDPDTDTWTLKASMPTPRSDFHLEVVHNKIYCIGGDTEGETNTQINEVYDPATDTWETREPLPTPRKSFLTVVLRDRIYVLGGANTGVTEVYDPATDMWERKSSMPNAGFPETCVVIKGKIYVISMHGIVYETSIGESISITAVYDEDTESWATKASMPVVQFGEGIAFDDEIYFIGDSSLLQIYDPSTDTWREGAKPPLGGVSLRSVFATTGKMAPRQIYIVDESLRIYDPEKNEWTLGPSKPTTRYSMGLAFLNDKIYAIGGITTIYSTDLFSPEYYIITMYATNEVYTPVGYGTIPPVIEVVSPESQTYNASGVSLNFTVNKLAEWMGYSLDGQVNVTVTGNVTIAGLSNGLHNVTVYARDERGNTGASETISFTVAAPFPIVLVAASTASVALVGVGLLVYFKKRRR